MFGNDKESMEIKMCGKFEKLRKGEKFRKWVKSGLLAVILSGSMFVGCMGMTVRAEENEANGHLSPVLGGTMKVQAADNVTPGKDFIIGAELTPSGRYTYDVQLTIENRGPDWEGTARMLVGEDYREPTAYDTAISLPSGSKKSFMVKIPRGNNEYSNEEVRVQLLDRKSRLSAMGSFRGLLLDNSNTLSMGILSDSYPDLTWLDMGGEKLYYYQRSQPIRLIELDQDNLTDVLDTLTLLVIDKFNTGVLTDAQLDAIEQWNQNGGVLILGTGSYAEDTLRAFGNSYLGIKAGLVFPPGTNDQLGGMDGGLEASELALAVPEYSGGSWNLLRESYYGWTKGSIGDGAVGILPYSLVDVAKKGDSVFTKDRQSYTVTLLDDICSEANARYDSYAQDYNNDWNSNMLTRMMRVMGNSDSHLSFGWLKFLVILYVIFAGPVLYLILCSVKKRELYWGAVPISALVGILLIALAGRGFRVVSTKVYSVSMVGIFGSDERNHTYLYCYDADNREWDLKLDPAYDYVGTMENNKYNYGSSDPDSYYHHVKRDGEGLSFGLKPDKSFEECYFVAGGRKTDVPGNLRGEGISFLFDPVGRVINETDRDLKYFAVISNDQLYVYEDLPAGGTMDLATAEPVYSDIGGGSSQGYYSWGGYLYSFLDKLYHKKQFDKASAASALGIGLYSVGAKKNQGSVLIIGVVEDWDKSVDDRCTEASYGCLYRIQ